jgi:DHA1 family multidrug resistance protein-like MFS transporter
MKSKNTSVAILFVSLVIVMLGFGIVLPLMPFYVTHFNASGRALGFLISIYSIMQFIFAPFWGQLSDRIGRKPVLMLGILGYAIAFALQGMSQNIWQFILARGLGGILSSATLPTAMAYVADITKPEERSKGVGMMGAAMGLGMIFGPMMGGLLTHLYLPLPAAINQTMLDTSTNTTIALSVPFFASSLLALIAFPIMHFLLPESLTPDKRQTKAEQAGGTRLTQLVEGLRGASGFLFAMAFLLAFALANMEGVLGLYGKKNFNIGPSELGLLMGAMGILSVIQQGFVIGPLTKKIGEENVLKSGLFISILGLVCLALAPTKWLMMGACLLFSVGNVLLQPSVTSLISKRAAPGQQGSAMGLNNSFQSLGRAMGPLWAGFAFDIYDTLSFWTGALIQLIAFAFSLRMLRPYNPPQPSVTPDPLPSQD